MAKKGRKRTPTKILRIRGSWRADLRKNEITPELKVPTMPAWLSPKAKNEWRRIVNILKSNGTITEMDRTIIAAYCQTYSDYLEALDYIREMGGEKGSKGGLLVRTVSGNIVQNPAIGIKNSALKILKSIAAELGMSPSARSQVLQPEAKTPEEKRKERFFKKSS